MKNKTPGLRRSGPLRLGRTWWALPVLSLLAWSCQLAKSDKVENTLSFSRIADSLEQFDEVLIELKKLDGTVLDTLYHGKVSENEDVKDLLAPGWDGSRVRIAITGIKAGLVVYQVESRYDPATGTRDEIAVFVFPDISLSTNTQLLTLLIGDSLSLPTVVVQPENLYDKTLEWRADPDSLLEVGRDFIVASRAGTGNLTVSLKTNPGAKHSIPFTIAAEGLVPKSLTIQPETLEVAANGPMDVLTAEILPVGAAPAVTWTTADSNLATVDSLGRVQGLLPGETTIQASSTVRPSVRAFAHVKVTGPKAVEKIDFGKDSTEIRVEAAAESLVVSVLPTDANLSVHFTLSDSNLASVQNGRIFGIAVGRITVIAASTAYPEVKDTLIINITGPIPVTSVRFAKDNLDILAGSGAESLLVTVEPPNADQSVTFSLSDPLKASVQKGKISGIAAGTLTVIANSVFYPKASDTLYVKVSLPAPDDHEPPIKPSVRVTPVGPTQVRRPVWSWASGGGGSGNYQVLLDKSNFDTTSISLSDTTYKPSVDLGMAVHVLYVRERDTAGNWSQPGSAQVEIDTAGPLAPIIHGTSPTSAWPRWTWSSGGGGGAGLFRSRLGDADFPAGASESIDTIYALTSAASGTTYSLYVQERDRAGNWSPSAQHPIKYDLTKPTLTISFPLASGTFITALDTATISGSATGPNGIAKVEYTVDAGPAGPITLRSGGLWSTPNILFVNARTTVIKVTATDSLGNKAEASLSILRDSDPPGPPVSLSAPTSPTNVTTASWTWSAGSDGTAGSGLNGKYRWKLNTGAWTEVTSAIAMNAALTEGTNTVSVQEQDQAGNWSVAVTGNLVLDTQVPDTVAFTGTDSTVSATLTPTWTWTSSPTNGGIGAYVLKLDAGPEFDWPFKTYTPASPLTDYAWHTLTVKEKDQVTGVTGAARTFTYRLKVNFDPSKPWGGLDNIPVKTSGCGKAAGVASGKWSITSSGQARDYIIDIPTGYDENHPYRLFFAFHSINGTAENMRTEGYFFLKPFADAENDPAIFIAPQGLSNSWKTTSDTDHVLFDDLLAYAKANLCLDSTRVFVTGWSLGGILANSLTANHQSQIRAAVGIAITNGIVWPTPVLTDPIAWMQTAGMRDGTFSWDQGGSTAKGGKYVALRHAQDNGCVIPDPIPTWQSGNHLCYDFSGCQAEFPTKACTFGGGHIYYDSDAGSTVNWIAEESWKFFKQF